MKEFFKSNVGTGAKNFKKIWHVFFILSNSFFLLGEGKNAFFLSASWT
jgi:hypothetical protein